MDQLNYTSILWILQLSGMFKQFFRVFVFNDKAGNFKTHIIKSRIY